MTDTFNDKQSQIAERKTLETGKKTGDGRVGDPVTKKKRFVNVYTTRVNVERHAFDVYCSYQIR
jgi:hypothetical protein